MFGSHPDRSEAIDGTNVGAVESAAEKTTPRSARASMCGLVSRSWPRHPRWSARRPSTAISRMPWPTSPSPSRSTLPPHPNRPTHNSARTQVRAHESSRDGHGRRRVARRARRRDSLARTRPGSRDRSGCYRRICSAIWRRRAGPDGGARDDLAIRHEATGFAAEQIRGQTARPAPPHQSRARTVGSKPATAQVNGVPPRVEVLGQRHPYPGRPWAVRPSSCDDHADPRARRPARATRAARHRGARATGSAPRHRGARRARRGAHPLARERRAAATSGASRTRASSGRSAGAGPTNA
ncbi:hypothetical protein Pla163_14570 [Planctomycetes bacterium Pla163]|uniref:Uncharacterized protein n=1 Tax=Rohdeia mirabilis TaxID=2528008 RepID=A0A518CYN9_9BACT|nr:hypothetical protein Pla163_14570 [Planctomycetes bacterium Pla163]